MRSQNEDVCLLRSGFSYSAHCSLLTPEFESHGGRSEGASARLPSANCQLPTPLCPLPYTLLTATLTPCAYCSRRYTAAVPGASHSHAYFSSGWGALNPARSW